MSDKFLLDYQSIAEYDSLKWFVEAKKFVVDYREFTLIHDAAYRQFPEVIKKYSLEVQQVFKALSHYTILRAPLDYLFYEKVFKELKRQNVTPIFDSNNSVLSQLNGDKFSQFYWYKATGLPTFKERLIGNLKQFFKNIKISSKGSYTYPLLACADEEQLAGGKIPYFYPYSIFSNKKITHKIEAEIRACVADLLEMLQQVGADCGMQLSANAVQTFTMETVDLAQKYLLCLQSIKRKIKKSTRYYVQNLGVPESRLVATAAFEKGCEVVSLGHGNEVGIQKDFEGRVEISADTTHYFIPSKNCESLIKSYLKECVRMRSVEQLKILVQPQEKYLQRWLQNSFQPSKTGIVMVVEGVINNYPLINQSFWYTTLNQQLEIAEVIKKSNKKSCIKVRPGNIAEKLYKNYDAIEYRKFEDVYQEAEVFVFPFIATSTFGFALTTDKPIVIFEDSLKGLWPETHELLSRRCRVVPTNYDGVTLTFDHHNFIEAITAPYEKPDKEFLEKYYFGVQNE